MEEKPNYYAIIPANVRYDTELKDKAKLLYGEITALSNENGYCYASNKYFANLYQVSVRTITDLIKVLIEKDYISSEIIYKTGTKEVAQRRLYLLKKTSRGIEENFYRGIEENFQDNNTSINNTSNNNIYNKAFEEIETIYGRTLNSMEYEKLINLFEKYNEKQVIHIYKKYGNKPVEYISKVLATTKPKAIPEWADKEITNESMDNVTLNDFNNFKDFLEGFRDGNI